MLKKVLLVFVMAAFAAGYARAQFSFGVRAGFNLTNISEKYDGKKPDGDEKGKFKPGFQLGVVGEYAFSESFALQPGILFAMQGTKWKSSDDVEKWKETMSLNYIQIPVHAQYRLNLGSVKLLLQAGPYFGLGIGGKYKYEYTYDGETDKGDTKIKFGDGDDEGIYYIDKAFDFGIGLGAGLQFSNFQAGIGYNFGLVNLSNEDKYSMKNNGLAITLTCLFGK